MLRQDGRRGSTGVIMGGATAGADEGTTTQHVPVGSDSARRIHTATTIDQHQSAATEGLSKGRSVGIFSVCILHFAKCKIL
jgi:hypothetical protein